MVELMFSCPECGLVKEKAFVRSRRPDEDVLDWMKEVASQVSIFHDLATPNKDCKPRTIREVYIPATEGKGIGFVEKID